MPLSTTEVEHTLNTLRIELPGSSDAGIKVVLWNVIKEFLQDSNAWIENQSLNVTSGVQDYGVTPLDGGQTVRLVGVLDGFNVPVNATMQNFGTLHVISKIQVTSIPGNPGQPIVLSASNPWTVILVKNIDLPKTRDDLPICPRFVLQVYSNYIEAGVMGRMMSQKNKSYSDPQLGKEHLARFKDGVNIARNDAWNQNVFGGQRWRYPQQFSVGTQRNGVSTAWPTGSS
jgi:hypothetical protein